MHIPVINENNLITYFYNSSLNTAQNIVPFELNLIQTIVIHKFILEIQTYFNYFFYNINFNLESLK